MSASSDVTLELRRPYLVVVAATAMFGGTLALFACLAATNDRGLVIDGVLPLSVGAARVFYAVLAVLSLCFVGMGAAGLWRLSRRSTYRLVIDERGITLPEARVWKSSDETTVSWRDLLGVTVSPQRTPAQVTFRSRTGVHVLHRRVLPPAFPLDRVARLVTERWRQS